MRRSHYTISCASQFSFDPRKIFALINEPYRFKSDPSDPVRYIFPRVPEIGYRLYKAAFTSNARAMFFIVSGVESSRFRLSSAYPREGQLPGNGPHSVVEELGDHVCFSWTRSASTWAFVHARFPRDNTRCINYHSRARSAGQ